MKQHQDQGTIQAATDVAGPELSKALAEIERLTRENEVLRKGASNPTGLSAVRGKLRTYRVSLPKMLTKRNSRCISPKMDAPAAIRQLPPVTYSDVSLFENEAKGDPAKLADAAWLRFVGAGSELQETGFDGTVRVRTVDPVRDRSFFTIDPVQGEVTDALEFRAESPADAFEKFRVFNGILSTIHSPVVQLIDDDDEQPPAARDVPAMAGV